MVASNSSGPSTATRIITVNPAVVAPPVAKFTASPLSGNAPLAVTFTDSSTGTPTSWAWNFGDGQTSVAQNPAHTYNASGTYSVTLTATNSGGSNATSKSIVVSPACAVPIAAFDTDQKKSGKPVDFTSNSTPTSPASCAINYWRWDYGDTFFDAGNFPTASHDYALPAHTYNVQLTVTSPAGTVTVLGTVTTK